MDSIKKLLTLNFYDKLLITVPISKFKVQKKIPHSLFCNHSCRHKYLLLFVKE